MHTLVMTTHPERAAAATRLPTFPSVVGFFFAFRIALTFVFFQSDPVTGSMVTIALDLALLLVAVLHTAGTGRDVRHLKLPTATRWVGLFLALEFVSLAWTETDSIPAAAAYWTGLVADTAIVLLLLRTFEVGRYATALMSGTVWGSAAAALVAWCSPVTSELRLGNDVYLHPNTLGMQAGIGALLAQYLAHRGDSRWKWLAIGLAITTVRTFSKTAIIAFAVAETWYLFKSSAISRAARRKILIGALITSACFWGVASSYLAIYNGAGSGNQAETLTGRTIVWATALQMGTERPWFGHGMYSFRFLMPAFGNFLPVHAHNEWIHLFFELGLTGVLVALCVYASLYRQARRAPVGELRLLVLTLLIFTLLHGITDTVPFGLSFPLWLITALSVCLAQNTAVHRSAV